jgi:tetratricopeptide (TPR) repeat protein
MKNIFLIIIIITTQSIFAASYNKPSASKLYKEAVELVKIEQFESAIKKLTKYTKKKPKDSDGWTLLAFSNRKISEFDKAKEFYERAISIDENNKNALEKLLSLCPNSCKEYEMLKDYINGKAKKS